jgi:ribosomal protein S18 acetylase RimI-like enzyme
MDPDTVQVTYLELRGHPASLPVRPGDEPVALESLGVDDYLRLYRQVGGPVGWDQRLRLPPGELLALLQSGRLRIYVLRDRGGEALGFCEFDRNAFPEIELKNFGVVPAAQGRGLGSRLLAVALESEWRAGPTRIWLHTDTCDHPAAVPLYERAGFKIYDVRREAVDDL